MKEIADYLFFIAASLLIGLSLILPFVFVGISAALTLAFGLMGVSGFIGGSLVGIVRVKGWL